MKNSKRILSVTIKRMIDDSPDTSWLGEYSNTCTSDEYSIDREHALDCACNTRSEDSLVWYTSSSGRIEFQMTRAQAKSVSHSGQCDNDVLELSRVPEIKAQLDKIDPSVLAAELKEYGAWDETERADHVQNLQRILWLAGNDISENEGTFECDCDGRGDRQRNEYRYFNPSFNYVDRNGRAKDLTPDEVRKYTRQDYDRMESLNADNWSFIGVRAEAEIRIPYMTEGRGGRTYFKSEPITSGGLWGIESDSDQSYFNEVETEQLAELRTELKAIGFSSRAISQAFKTIQRKDS